MASDGGVLGVLMEQNADAVYKLTRQTEAQILALVESVNRGGKDGWKQYRKIVDNYFHARYVLDKQYRGQVNALNVDGKYGDLLDDPPRVWADWVLYKRMHAKDATVAPYHKRLRDGDAPRVREELEQYWASMYSDAIGVVSGSGSVYGPLDLFTGLRDTQELLVIEASQAKAENRWWASERGLWEQKNRARLEGLNGFQVGKLWEAEQEKRRARIERNKRGARSKRRRGIVEHQARWARIAHTGSCGLCLLCGSRGFVYKEETVRFRSHARCCCVFMPCPRRLEPESTRIEACRNLYRLASRMVQGLPPEARYRSMVQALGKLSHRLAQPEDLNKVNVSKPYMFELRFENMRDGGERVNFWDWAIREMAVTRYGYNGRTVPEHMIVAVERANRLLGAGLTSFNRLGVPKQGEAILWQDRHGLVWGVHGLQRVNARNAWRACVRASRNGAQTVVIDCGSRVLDSGFREEFEQYAKRAHTSFAGSVFFLTGESALEVRVKHGTHKAH